MREFNVVNFFNNSVNSKFVKEVRICRVNDSFLGEITCITVSNKSNCVRFIVSVYPNGDSFKDWEESNINGMGLLRDLNLVDCSDIVDVYNNLVSELKELGYKLCSLNEKESLVVCRHSSYKEVITLHMVD